MIGMEKSASAHLPAAGVWLRRGAGLARAISRAAGAGKGLLRRSLAGLARARARRHAVRVLYGMDNRMLQDIGISREQIESAVSGMLARPQAGEAVRPVREVEADETTEIGVARVCNDRHYESAA